MIVGALLIAFALWFVAYAILQVAAAVNTLAEQLSLGVRLTSESTPSAVAPDLPQEGVVSWPSADGWAPPAASAASEVPDTVPQWKDTDGDYPVADDAKARTSDNNHPQASAEVDESPELRGKRGGVVWP